MNRKISGRFLHNGHLWKSLVPITEYDDWPWRSLYHRCGYCRDLVPAEIPICPSCGGNRSN